MKKESKLSKTAEIHDILNIHDVCRKDTYTDTLGVCKACNHIIIKNSIGKWKTATKKNIQAFCEFEWLNEYSGKKKVIALYEKLNYLFCPSFAYFMAKDVIKGWTKISKEIANIDEVYGFHYANKIEKRTTEEEKKEFYRLLRKRLESSDSVK
jgi:hypothetical protein